MTGFGERLAGFMAARGPVCTGIDPHAQLLGEWGLEDSAEGVREFGLRVVDALYDHTAAFKPQSAFFERHGSRGIAALEDVVEACRQAKVPVILDVKRGDICSTMDGYAGRAQSVFGASETSPPCWISWANAPWPGRRNSAWARARPPASGPGACCPPARTRWS